MNQQQWNEGLDHMDEELLQTYLLEKEQNRQKQRTTTHRMYIAAVACILCLIFVTLVLAPILKSRMQSQNDAPILQDNTSPVIGNTNSSNEHRPLHTYTDLAAYEAYISATDQLTSDFISYGQLEMLGDFRRVLFGNKNTNGKYTTSNYAFTDRNGFSYSLNIKYEGEPYVLDRPIYEIINEMESMLDAQSNDKYAIIKNNKYYIYSGGVLSSICWYENNIRFQIGLCDYESSANYPLGGEITFITRILSLDDNVSGTAFAELSASINQ